MTYYGYTEENGVRTCRVTALSEQLVQDWAVRHGWSDVQITTDPGDMGAGGERLDMVTNVELDALSAVVDTKADQTVADAKESKSVVATKADQTDVDALAARIAALESAIIDQNATIGEACWRQDESGDIVPVYRLNTPTLASNPTYTGETVSPEWNGFDPAKMTVSGNEAVEIGTYTAMFVPVEGNMWRDNTAAPRTVEWQVMGGEN